MEADFLGGRHQRHRRWHDEDPKKVRTGFGLLARICEAQQRAGLPVPKVSSLVGNEQRRPPGSHLQLHHSWRCCQHLGLRCDDEFLQRHSQLTGDDPDWINPSEAHPVALQHLLKAKQQNNAAMIVCDPRFTRTAAHATEYVRFRPGTDLGLIWGILWHVFENGWEDKEYIRQCI